MVRSKKTITLKNSFNGIYLKMEGYSDRQIIILDCLIYGVFASIVHYKSHIARKNPLKQ